jgi:hypothetical protein
MVGSLQLVLMVLREISVFCCTWPGDQCSSSAVSLVVAVGSSAQLVHFHRSCSALLCSALLFYVWYECGDFMLAI